MKTGSLFFFFFLISVAAIVLNQGAVDAGRVLKKNIILTSLADTIPCDHHNLLNGDHELEEGILKNKLTSGPSGGVGHNYINSVGSEKMKTSNTLKMNKLPSGPSGGVGHNYINSVGSEKMKTSNTLKMNKLPSGPSGGVGHKYINAAGKASAAERLITTTPFNKLTTLFNKLPSGPSGGVGHNNND